MKANETLFKSLKAALEAGNKEQSLKVITELEGTNLTTEDKSHLAEAKTEVTNGEFMKAMACVKYLW